VLQSGEDLIRGCDLTDSAPHSSGGNWHASL